MAQSRRRWSAGALTLYCMLAQPLAAQTDWDATAEVANLADPAQRARAISRLLSLGKQAVPALEACLADHGAPATQLDAALFVTGKLANKLGADSLPLLEPLHGLFRVHPTESVRRQALWALGCVGVFAPPQQADDLRQNLASLRRQVQDGRLHQVVCSRLFLVDLSPEAILTASRGPAWGWPERMAQAQNLAAGVLQANDDLLDDYQQRLEDFAAPRPWPWQLPTGEAWCVGEYAAVLFQLRGTRSRAVARGLVRHWDPELRHEGLLQLSSHALAETDVLALATCAADGDRRVRDLALQLLRDQGANGIPALWLLCAPWEWDRATQAMRSQVAQGLMQAAANGNADCLRQLQAIATTMGGGDLPAGILDATIAHLLPGILHGAAGAPAELIGKLTAGMAESAWTPACERSLIHLQAAAHSWPSALQALAWRGPGLLSRFPELPRLLLQAWQLHSWTGSGHVFGFLAELCAGRAAETATLQTLARATLQQEAWPIVARAWIELLYRNEVPSAEDVAKALDALLVRDALMGLRVNGAQGAWSLDVQSPKWVLQAAAAAFACLGGDARWSELLPLDDEANAALAGRLREASTAAQWAEIAESLRSELHRELGSKLRR